MSQRVLKKQFATDAIRKDVGKGIIIFWKRIRNKLIKTKRLVQWGDYRFFTIITVKKKQRRKRSVKEDKEVI